MLIIPVKKIISFLEQKKNYFSLTIISKINLFIPQKYCFNFWLFIVKRKIINFDKINNNAHLKYAINLNVILNTIAKQQKEFHIPYSITGQEKINPNESSIFISVHLPLNKVALRAFEASGCAIKSIIANYSDKGDEMTIWGTKRTIPVILGNSQSFVKAKNALKIGNLGLFIDNGTESLNPNIFFLSQKLNKKVYFLSTVLAKDFSVEIKFKSLPFPYNLNLLEIEQNIKFIKDEVKLIYDNYSTV
jgi:hypothetical protein